ncbi:ABC transporter ATP-binding protein [Olsenella phocaeensis]|uniref:ABC transporter ATP-binding protein n=1 Tax=Olsenella phocaeensis TaxID=1852385 RepID=UPI003A8EAEFC
MGVDVVPSRGDGLLRLRKVMKEYDGETILAGCDLDVGAGESVAVVGASGEGKSTLLSIAGLLLTPSAGTVLVDGTDASRLSDQGLSALRARAFGFVFQHTQLVGSLRAIDNILVPACFGGADMAAAAERAAALIELLGLSHRANHFPHQLSVGQKRRVALARAMVLSPLAIVADEPTNDLDSASAGIVEEALLGYADEGHAVLVATHDMALARSASRAVRLRDGRLAPAGDAELEEGARRCSR